MKKVQIIPIKGTNYYATNIGEIVNKQGRPLKGAKIEDYSRVWLRINNKTKGFMRSRLIYETFIGEIKSGMHVHFIDGNKNNCNINNLTLMTHKNIMNQKIVKNKLSVPRCMNMNKYDV